ncbi:MAG: M14 family zinc carboxypeptidase [Bacteroidota bacterium]|nr:M14 family zinc carboxypeptidase [Bacteroidota bacterium]
MTSNTARKLPAAKPVKLPSKARNTWCRTATSCTSGLMYNVSLLILSLKRRIENSLFREGSIRFRLKKLVWLFVILTIISTGSALSQTPAQLKTADSILSKRGEVYFSFDLPETIPIYIIGKQLSVDKLKNGRVWAYANRREFIRFRKLNLPFTLEAQIRARVSIRSTGTSPWDHFPTYPEYLALMAKFATDYPALCRVSEFGKSVSGRSLMSIKISNKPDENKASPGVLYVGTIHGDEPVGYALMLRFIDYLLSNYNTPQVKALVDSSEIWICPLANPDGTYFGGDMSIAEATRYNANSVDLNRNFPDPTGNLHPDGNDWQPETQAMMAFLNTHHLELSANFHSGAELVNYPWDSRRGLHADDAWFEEISRQYADTVHAHSPALFFTYENNGITNGYNWYSADGSRQDYATYYASCREVTIEMNADKIPSESQLENLWQYHFRSMFYYLQQCRYGIQGKVTDEETGLPVKASITLVNHDNLNSQVYSDSVNGMYFRPIAAGTYQARVSAPGYYTRTFSSLPIGPQAKLTLDIPLRKTTKAFTNDSLNITFYPNPVRNILHILPNVAYNLPVAVEITDISGKHIANYQYSNLYYELAVDFSMLPKGLYIVTVRAGNRNISGKVLKD